MRRRRQKATLNQRRWLNRRLIWPMRKVNRLIIKHDAIMRLLIVKSRQWGTSPNVYALATSLYKHLKYETNHNQQ